MGDAAIREDAEDGGNDPAATAGVTTSPQADDPWLWIFGITEGEATKRMAEYWA